MHWWINVKKGKRRNPSEEKSLSLAWYANIGIGHSSILYVYMYYRTITRIGEVWTRMEKSVWKRRVLHRSDGTITYPPMHSAYSSADGWYRMFIRYYCPCVRHAHAWTNIFRKLLYLFHGLSQFNPTWLFASTLWSMCHKKFLCGQHLILYSGTINTRNENPHYIHHSGEEVQMSAEPF